MTNGNPTPASNRRLHIGLGIALLAGVAAVIVLMLPASFFRSGFVRDDIAVTFLDRNGNDAGKRGVPGEPPAPGSRNYFLDWADSEVQRLMKGRGEKVLTALTTFDPALQDAAGKAIEERLAESGEVYKVKQAALVSLELPDGAVRAMAGGRDYAASPLNSAAVIRRLPGSSFKPYVYLTALENGYTPSSTETDGPVSCGNWQPESYGRPYKGSMQLWQALAQSINTIAVKLSLNAGREKVLANLKKLGINEVQISCSMALGDQPITVLEHTAGFAHFASGGMAVRPYAIIELRNAQGEVVYSRARDEPAQQQIFDRRVIENLNGMLQKAVTDGTGKAAALDFTSAAGKSGTSTAYKDAWFVGFTGRYVTGVWFGNGDFSPTNKMTGGTLPAQTWKAYNTAAHGDTPVPPIPGIGPQPPRKEEAPARRK